MSFLQQLFLMPYASLWIPGGIFLIVVGGVYMFTRLNPSLKAADPQDGLSDYFVCIRGENVTLETERPGISSARNHLHGSIVEIAPAGSLMKVVVDIGFEVTALVTRPFGPTGFVLVRDESHHPASSHRFAAAHISWGSLGLMSWM